MRAIQATASAIAGDKRNYELIQAIQATCRAIISMTGRRQRTALLMKNGVPVLWKPLYFSYQTIFGGIL
jgi:hypothetical protein